MDTMIADKPVVDETTTQPVDEHFSEFKLNEVGGGDLLGYRLADTSLMRRKFLVLKVMF